MLFLKNDILLFLFDSLGYFFSIRSYPANRLLRYKDLKKKSRYRDHDDKKRNQSFVIVCFAIIF